MSDTRWQNCPQCNARNSQTAAFCGQCFASFVPEPPKETQWKTKPNTSSTPEGTPSSPLHITRPPGATQGNAGQVQAQPVEPAQPVQPDHELSDTEISLLLAQSKRKPAPPDPSKDNKMSSLPGMSLLDPSSIRISDESIHLQAVFKSNSQFGDKPNQYGSHEDELIWTCGSCDSTQTIDIIVCPICGRGIAQEVTKPAEHPAQYYVTRELLFPGFGLVSINNSSYGYSRMIIVIIWLLVAASLMFANNGIYMALPLLLGTAFMWITGPRDVRATLANHSILLSGSRFLYFVITIFVLSFLVGGLIVSVLKQ